MSSVKYIAMDEFENIIGYEGYYQINRLGQVRNIAKLAGRTVGKILKPSFNTGGYAFVILSKDNIKKNHKVHRLLGIQFISNPENKPTIDHIDRNRSNNNIENLRWATHIENSNNCCNNITAEQKKINRINRIKRQNLWRSAKREFLRILLQLS